MEYNTKLKPRVKSPKKTWDKSKTQQTGYIPANVQIERFIDAGTRLIAARNEMYDFPPGVESDDDLEVPIRDPNFDLADASRLERENTARLEETAKIMKNEKKAEKAEKEEKNKKMLEKAEKYDKLKEKEEN